MIQNLPVQQIKHLRQHIQSHGKVCIDDLVNYTIVLQQTKFQDIQNVVFCNKNIVAGNFLIKLKEIELLKIIHNESLR